MGLASEVNKIAVTIWGNALMTPKEMEKMEIRLLFGS